MDFDAYRVRVVEDPRPLKSAKKRFEEIKEYLDNDPRYPPDIDPEGGTKTKGADPAAERAFNEALRQYIETDAGQSYTWVWTDVEPTPDGYRPGDSTVRAARDQDPLLLLPDEERAAIRERIKNRHGPLPWDTVLDESLDRKDQQIRTDLLDHYDGNLDTVLDHHVDVCRVQGADYLIDRGKNRE